MWLWINEWTATIAELTCLFSMTIWIASPQRHLRSMWRLIDWARFAIICLRFITLNTFSALYRFQFFCMATAATVAELHRKATCCCLLCNSFVACRDTVSCDPQSNSAPITFSVVPSSSCYLMVALACLLNPPKQSLVIILQGIVCEEAV